MTVSFLTCCMMGEERWRSKRKMEGVMKGGGGKEMRRGRGGAWRTGTCSILDRHKIKFGQVKTEVEEDAVKGWAEVRRVDFKRYREIKKAPKKTVVLGALPIINLETYQHSR